MDPSKPKDPAPGADTANKQPAPVPLIRPIDCETLLKRYRGERSLVERLVSNFARQIDKQLQSLRQELSRRDVEAAARSVHSIQSSATDLSAEPMRASAAELERQLLANEFQQAEQSMRRLESQVRECRDYLPDAMARVRGFGKREK